MTSATYAEVKFHSIHQPLNHNYNHSDLRRDDLRALKRGVLGLLAQDDKLFSVVKLVYKFALDKRPFPQRALGD